MQTLLSFLLNCKNADNANGEWKNYRAFKPALYAEDEIFIPPQLHFPVLKRFFSILTLTAALSACEIPFDIRQEGTSKLRNGQVHIFLNETS